MIPLSAKTRLFIAAMTLLSPVVSTATAPNLIVILADDLGYADVGFNGAEDIRTPHIDGIARDGVRFSSGYVTYAVCGPSRAGLMTGRYGQRFGFERNPQYRPLDPHMGLPLSEDTLADVLKRVGYTSGAIGKWHLGAHDTLHPLQRGFDSFFGHLGGGHRYFPEELTIEDSKTAKNEEQSYRTWILRDREPVRTTQYLTDEFSDAAVDFVTANHDRPFFLYLAYNAPHGPLQASEPYLARYPDIKDPKRRTYAAMVSAVDDGVGRVLAKLRELGIEENTIVFFLSDNGGPTAANASRNTPLRGVKGEVWEGGFRVPFAMKWPAALAAGATFDAPVSSLDIFATITALADAPLTAERPLDGVNLIPYLQGKNSGTPHEAIYLRKFDAQEYAVRSHDFKLITGSAGSAPQLYHLDDDIGETTNLIETHRDTAASLEQLRAGWDAELIDPTFEGLQQLRQGKAKEGAAQKREGTP